MTDARPLRWFRWGLGAWTVAHLAPRLPYLSELYCRPVLRDDVLEWLGLGPPPWALVVALVAAALAGAVLQARSPRVGLALVVPALVALDALDPNSMRAYGLVATVTWGLLAVCALAGVDLAADRVPAWVPRLLVAQWCSVYALSVSAKLAEPAWRTGDALFLALNSDAYGRWGLSAGGVPHPVAQALGYAAMATELAIGVAPWHPRTRWLAVLGSLGFHAGIAASMKISWLFPAVMWLHLPLVLSLDGPPAQNWKYTKSAAATR